MEILLNVCFDARIEMTDEEGEDVSMCKGLEDLIAEYKAEAEAEGRAEGRVEILTALVAEGLISKDVAAEKAQMSAEEFNKIIDGINI